MYVCMYVFICICISDFAPQTVFPDLSSFNSTLASPTTQHFFFCLDIKNITTFNSYLI